MKGVWSSEGRPQNKTSYAKKTTTWFDKTHLFWSNPHHCLMRMCCQLGQHFASINIYHCVTQKSQKLIGFDKLEVWTPRRQVGMVLPNWYPGELLNAVSKSVMEATFLTHPTHCEVYWFCTVVIRMFRVRKLSERAPCRVTYNKDSLRLSFSFFSSFHAAFLSFFSQISSYIRTCESLKGNTHNFSLETKNEGNVTSGPCTLSLSLVFVHQLQCMELKNCPWFKLFVVVTHLLGADTIVLLPFSASVFAPKEKMCFAMN